MTSACHSLKGLLRDLVDVPSVLDTWLYGLTADSRRVRPGMAFLAFAGGGRFLDACARCRSAWRFRGASGFRQHAAGL